MKQQRQLPPVPPADRFSEKQKENPEDSLFQNRKNPGSSFRSSAGQNRTDQKDGQRKSRGYRPFRMQMILALSALLCAGSAFVTQNLFGWGASASYETYVADYGLYPSLVESEPVFFYISDNSQPVVTFRFSKINPEYYISSGYGNISFRDGVLEEFAEIPELGVNTDEAWMSYELPIYYSKEEGDSLSLSDFSLMPEEGYYETLSAYVYSENSQDPDFLKRKYRSENAWLYPEIEVTDEGLDSIRHTAAFTVTPKSETLISQEVQVLYKKNGQVVYAGTMYIDGDPSDGRPMDFYYTPEIDVPEYDEVEIHSLN